MSNGLGLPIIRLVQRLSMLLTLGCFLYIAFFLISKAKEDVLPDNSSAVASSSMGSVSVSPLLAIQTDSSVNTQARDIFSLSTDSAGAVLEATPKGQLPNHLKVVGIVVAHPSQIIIEDSLVNKTYFIDETHPDGGVKIVKTGRDQMIINYQGQDIPVAITKN